MVLRREDVAARPGDLGAERRERLDEHRGLDRHVEAAGDARALERLRLRRTPARSAIRPGISFSAMPISLRPQSARSMSATLYFFVSIMIQLSLWLLRRHHAACYEKFERVVAALFTRVDLRNNLELLTDEPGLAELGHQLVASEAEPDVALLFAQPLVPMSDQIDDHQRAARAQDAHHLF